ncbi:hypothetical protein, partial [Treponema socranskii]|uniref:hypothetical protein n=1 Tax=Treponema socranskii TaxID=53419 RepID=UPI00361224E1
GKPYFLTARTKTHSFCLETEDGVAPNGTVDLARAVTAIYPRAHEREAGDARFYTAHRYACRKSETERKVQEYNKKQRLK